MTQFDPILTEVIKTELTAVAEEMGITMKRTARSLGAKEGSDFSTALVDADGQLIAQGLTIGIHLGYIMGVMPWVLEKFGDQLNPGDVIVSNDPYGGVSHFPDIVLVMPIFWKKELVGFSAIVEHHTDIGGRFPGGMGIACAEVYEEGVRIPGVKLYSRGELNEDLVNMLAANVRVPEDLRGDLDAQAAACRRGAKGLEDLLDRHGFARFVECNVQLRRYSEHAMRACIRGIPNGTYEYIDRFEDDGIGGDGVELRLAIVVEDGTARVDFAGTDPQVPSAVNVPFNLTRACVYVAFRSILENDVPANAGLVSPITVLAPQGCVVNPSFPGAVGARGMMMWRIIDMVFAALAKAIPEKVYAAGEGGANLLVYTADNDEGGVPSMLLDIYTSGWGARPDSDGVEGVTPMAAGGVMRSIPAEMVERECPILIEGFGFVEDTGGAGRFRGALSVFRKWRFLQKGRVMLRTCRVSSLPYGLAGGHDGTSFQATLEDENGREDLPQQMMIDRHVDAGQVLTHVQPGAGGYGDPFERDPALVLEDVVDEKITAEYAAHEYGVVVDTLTMTVDCERTRQARAENVRRNV